MNKKRIRELRNELDNDSISYGELIENAKRYARRIGGDAMNKKELARLKEISGENSLLYQLAQKDASNRLQTSHSDILEPEAMQEKADAIRKDDSEPDFLDGVQTCDIENPDCEACQ